MEYLYDRLKTYSESDYYGFHMPGHKRNSTLTGAKLPYEIDITEIEGFDDLHHAEGILKERQQRAADVFGAEETHYLVNGSTVGLLCAVLGCTKRRGKMIMARNCHKSVYNAVYINELHPVYLYPEYTAQEGLNGVISPEQVRRALEDNRDADAVIITSPTYDGVVSDIEAIAGIVHSRGIPLIVDEAHGAHFSMHSYFPENANKRGADVVIHSLHKTLPALTQTGLLHINGPYADRASVRKYLHMLQSSSPSYVFMAGIDECVRLLETKGSDLFDPYVRRLDELRRDLRQMKHLHIVETEHYDRSKILIAADRGLYLEGTEDSQEFNGRALYETLLTSYHLQMEMAASSYVIAMTSPADTEEGFMRLRHALLEIDARLSSERTQGSGQKNSGQVRRGESADRSPSAPQGRLRAGQTSLCYTPYELEDQARQKGTCTVEWKDALECISAEYAYLYPPGIPLIVPGERVSAEVTEQILYYEGIGFTIEGTARTGHIKVLNER